MAPSSSLWAFAALALAILVTMDVAPTASAAAPAAFKPRSVCDTGLGEYVDMCNSACARANSWMESAAVLQPPDWLLNPPVLAPLAEVVSEAIDVQVDIVRVLFSLHLVVPLMALYQFFFPPTANAVARELVGSILGICVLIFAHGHTWGIVLFLVVGSYVIMRVLGPRYCHWATFAFTLGYLTVYQFHLMCVEYSMFRMDLTTVMMMRTIQITTMSLNYHDGAKKKKLEEEANDESIPIRKRTYKRDILMRALVEMPSFFEYLSMMFNLACCFGPPAYDMVEFRKFMRDPPAISLRKVFPSVLLRQLMADFFGIALFLLIGAAYVPSSYLGTDDYAVQPFVYKVLYIMVCIFCVRGKFYGFFMHIEAIQLVAGMRELVIKSETGEAQFLPFSNMRIIEFGNKNSDLPFGLGGIESATRPAILPSVWNVMVSRWLRHVYERSIYLGTIPAMLVTYSLSAFWHGIYLTIYVCFFSFLFLQIITNELSRRYAIWCLSLPTIARRIIAIVARILTIFSAEFVFIPFLIMDLDRGMRLWHALHYCVFIGLAVLALVLALTPSPKPVHHVTRQGNHHHSLKKKQQAEDSGVVVSEEKSAGDAVGANGSGSAKSNGKAKRD